jgi:hypothetical protein
MEQRKKVEELIRQVAKAAGLNQHSLGEATLDFPVYRDDKRSNLQIELPVAWKKYDGKKVHVFVYIL